MRRQIPLLITFVVGMVMLLEAFIPHPPFDQLNESLSITFDVLAAFAFVLGGGNLAKIHLAKISRSEPGWGYSAVTMGGFFTMLAIGLFKVGGPAGLKHALEAKGTWFQAAYDYCFLPLSATTFSLLAFFVASASYRAFRAKNREATLLLIAALIILLGRTLVGAGADRHPAGLARVAVRRAAGHHRLGPIPFEAVDCTGRDRHPYRLPGDTNGLWLSGPGRWRTFLPPDRSRPGELDHGRAPDGRAEGHHDRHLPRHHFDVAPTHSGGGTLLSWKRQRLGHPHGSKRKTLDVGTPANHRPTLDLFFHHAVGRDPYGVRPDD